MDPAASVTAAVMFPPVIAENPLSAMILTHPVNADPLTAMGGGVIVLTAIVPVR